MRVYTKDQASAVRSKSSNIMLAVFLAFVNSKSGEFLCYSEFFFDVLINI